MSDVGDWVQAAARFQRRRLLRQMRDGLLAAFLFPKLSPTALLESCRTLKPGVLRIGTYFVNPPFEFISNGKTVGFEVDLMREIARRLGLQPEFADTRWETILHEMQESRYDCIIGGITITPARQRLLAWSIPYMTTTLSLLVDSTRSPAPMISSDLTGATVGVQGATTDYDEALEMERTGKIRNVKIYSFAEIANALTDLAAGRIQAVMKVYPVAAWFARHTPGLRILDQIPNDPQRLGIGFNKSNTGLVAAVNDALIEMQRDGSRRALAQRWRVS
jgi:ABC-type amino acid transport substrate-binding protein